MIQSKAKNKYWQAGKRWRVMAHIPKDIHDMDFQNYQYIIGDKIYTEINEESEAAFKSVLMWIELQK